MPYLITKSEIVYAFGYIPKFFIFYIEMVIASCYLLQSTRILPPFFVTCFKNENIFSFLLRHALFFQWCEGEKKNQYFRKKRVLMSGRYEGKNKKSSSKRLSQPPVVLERELVKIRSKLMLFVPVDIERGKAIQKGSKRACMKHYQKN